MHVSGAAGGASDADREPVVSDEPDLRSTAQRTIVDLTGRGPFVSVGHYRYLEAQDALPLQVHSRLFVIAFAIRSRFDFVVNGRQVRVEPGEAILIPPGNAYSTGADAQSRGELVWLVLRMPAEAAEADDAWQHLDLVMSDLASQGVTTCRSPRLSVELLTLVLETAGDDDQRMALWRDTTSAAALAELWRMFPKRGDATDPTHPALRRAVAWASSNVESAISMTTLVDLSGLSRTHFYALFRETYGTSPMDFVMRMKIERAAALLSESTMSITDVAYRLGFSSSQHFGTAFRRYVGIPPSAYRARIG